MSGVKEKIIQRHLVRWFRYEYPKLKKLFFHVPNGGSRNAREAANLKKEGVVAGVSDMSLAVAAQGFHGLYLELKSENGELTQKQSSFLTAVNVMGYCGLWVNSLDEAMKTISWYLEGFPHRDLPF